MKSKHYFQPKDGKLNLENCKGFQDRVKLLKEKRHVLMISEDTLTRSEKQNRYMWGCVYKIMGDELGYLPDECHQLMQKQFLKYESQGEWFVKSTTKLNTKEMEEYLENVRRFASMELSIYVPLPNETEFSYEVKK